MKKIISLSFILFAFFMIASCENSSANHIHGYNENKIDATCTTDGCTEYVCSCGYKYTENKVEALGHSYAEWNIVKEPTENQNGLKEKYCLNCNDKVTEEIPSTNKKSVIIFGNLKNSLYEEKYEFDSTVDLKISDLPIPELTGYKFIGWYTNSQDGVLVDHILASEPNTYYLYAHWDIVSYKINYIDAPIHNNNTEYTIEDSFELTPAKWEGDGIIFSHWINDNGEVVETIDEGTTGNFSLIACWMYKENYVVSSSDTESFSTVYDSAEKIYFIYKLGTIQNVVISTADEFPKTSLTGKTLKSSETISVQKGLANNISNSITSIVTKSEDWSIAKEQAQSHSESVSEKISSKVEVGLDLGIKSEISASLQIGVNDTSSWAETSTNGYTDVVTSEFDETFQSTVTFNYSKSKTFEETYIIPENAPNGLYSYVAMTDVYVFMIVTYDRNDGNYYLNTYSVVSDKIMESVLYSPRDSNLNIEYSKPLSYNLKFDEMDKIIENSYFVEYDANGGVGTMDTSLFTLNKEQKLSENKFTKDGYIFSGWSTSPTGDVLYNDEEIVSNITIPKETIKLYAKWAAKPIIVDLESNGGQLENSSVIIMYGENYGVLPIPQRGGYTFEGWYYGSTLVKEDMQLLSSFNHTLEAIWNKNTYEIIFHPNGGSGTMPSQKFEFGVTESILENLYTKVGHTAIGWSLEENGDVVYKNEQNIVFNDTKSVELNLYAVWDPNTYYLYIYDESDYHFNNPLYELPFKYEAKITTSITAPEKEGYVFYNWSAEIPSKMPATDVYIFAQYLSSKLTFAQRTSTVYTITDSGRENQPYDEISLSNLEKYKELGYTKLNITISLEISEKNKGYQHIFLYNNLGFKDEIFKDYFILKDVNGTDCTWELEHSGSDLDTNYKEYTVTSNLIISLDAIISGETSKDSVYIVYGASGDDNDTWYNKNLKVTILFEK